DRSLNSPTSWSWDFDGDGTEDGALQNPSYAYSSPGLQAVALDVANGAGSSSKTRAGYICVTSGTAPPVVMALVAPDRTTLAWAPQASGTTFDVVKGDLAQLHVG